MAAHEMLKTVICDDELPALKLLASLLEDTGMVEIVAACQSVEEALSVVNGSGIDLLIMDIEMPELSGVAATRQITVTPKPLLIFATAHAEYALDAFSVDAIDYLLKPINQTMVTRAVQKAARLCSVIAVAETSASDEKLAEPAPADTSRTLKIRDGGFVYFISYDDIYWIEAAGDYSLVHTTDREYAIRKTLREFEEELPLDRFVRVHRSAIISSSQVREVKLLTKGEATIVLASGHSVKSSRSYRDAVKALTTKTP
ncbi:LytTR family DNA-binding domain-containing protein [Parvularcula sp. LCG005]|uniref:LytR/AlgR family response regulator transcription factor n=1 Tax=Parvularcula sp. LCG005 TaxID=3078805 RepID=UPI002943F7B2|nr:LytTR family DNA-binding domain-containing protein [Parvularcula sp. LCG005]WOI52662.1 LytTR family DNA-binding domain-containing protein [Parvularcula sp. LCG005]